MNILDRLALNSLIKTILNFIIGILKIFAPNSVKDLDVPDKKRKPRWRKNDE